MKQSKKVKKKNNIKTVSRNFTEADLKVLAIAARDGSFNFSEEDLTNIQDVDIPASSKSHGRAEVALKKIRRMQKSHGKKLYRQKLDDQKATKAPMSKGLALQTFMKIKEGQELAASMEVMLDILIKNKLVTKKGFEKLWQEKVLDHRHPDPCPSCKAFEPAAKKGKLPCILDFTDRTEPTLAKTRFPDLTGAKAKRVIACESYDHDTNPNPEFPEEPENEKSNDNEEGTKDNS